METKKNTHPHVVRWLALMVCLLASSWVHAVPQSGSWAARSISLGDLGLVKPVTLNQQMRERHFYFPIAQNIALKDAYIDLDLTYLRQFSGEDGLTILVNGSPVRTHSFAEAMPPPFLKMTGIDGKPWSTDAPGSANEALHLSIPLKNLDPTLRFVDVSLSFNTKKSTESCTYIAGRGNELLLDPGSRLRYRFDRSSVLDVRTFLTTLPEQAQILLPSQPDALQYEAALRLLMGLQAQGLNPKLVVFPKIGDEVATGNMRLPGSWNGIPMFQSLLAALRQQQKFHIANDADVAAWLAIRLSSASGLADVLVDSAGLRAALLKAGEIWREQGVLQRLPAAVQQAITWGKTSSAQANLALVNWAEMQMLLLDSPDQNPAALLTGSFWSAIANGAELGVAHVGSLGVESHTHRLMIAQNLPVQYLRAEVHWEIPFAAKDMPNGERPNALQLNIVSAHRTGDVPAVVSVFMNDFLLTAKDLRSDGEITAVNAFVPLYTLKSNNVVRIEVFDSDKKSCFSSQALPVQVLPSSYLGLGGAGDVQEFFSFLPLLTSDSTVIIPPEYLQHQGESLSTVSRVLQGLGMSAGGYKIELPSSGDFVAHGPFVSFEVLPKGLSSLVETRLDQLVVRDKSRAVVLDSKGLGSLAVAQIIAGQGVLVSRVGKDALDLQVPLEFSAGNLAIMDGQGVKLTLNTHDPQQEFSLNESGRGLAYMVERYHVPFVIAAIVLLIALLLFVIRAVLKERHRRMARRSGDRHTTS